MPLAPGTQLGLYEIVAPLGAGGMGEVYRARDSRLGRQVAVKVMPESFARDADRLARFEREARTVAGLNHPNIVTLHSIEESSGIRFLTMELVEGQNLDQLVTPGGLPLARVLDLGLPMADALVAAHERGVVHRDLKPGNVMVTRDGRVKVLDFGLAKPGPGEGTVDATRAMTTPITEVGQVFGTVPYMAPEQVRGEAVDARSDLFSLGVILFELATGRRPFVGDTAAEVISSILRDAPPPLESLRSDLPADLGRVVSRCLEKDPEQRVQTAKDVRNELRLARRALESAAPSASRPAPARAEAPAQELPSIAVLPFVNRGRDPEDEDFADGLADELLNVLGKIRGLRVAARTSSFTFKGKQATIGEIARSLGVATVLEGSLRKAGTRVRIAVQLVKASDGYHLWTETYDRTLDDIFAVQDDIAQSVVKELRSTLLGLDPDSQASGDAKADVAAAAKGRGDNPEAHRLFLQGRFLVNRLGQEDVAKGIAQLRQALEIEPNHALAWGWLSWGLTLSAITGHVPLEPAIPMAREAATRAVTLGPDLAESHNAMGALQLWYDFDLKGAEGSFRRAMELAPGSAEILRAQGLLLGILGRFDEALELCRRAIDQDPLSAVSYMSIARAFRWAGRLDDAERMFRRALEISPDATSAHLLLALALDAQGRRDEALAEVLQEKADWARLYGLAVVHHTAGRREDSDRALQELTETMWEQAGFQIGTAHAARGETAEAFEWLERGHHLRDSGVLHSKVEPLLRSLYSDPRWLPFLRKLGLES